MLKKICICAVALIMGLSVSACGNAGNNTTKTGEEENPDTTAMQLQLIADNIDTWRGDDTEVYNYAVTDLDQNGRLEIISSSCQGTGLYTYTDVWEVDEALSKLDPIENPVVEGDSQADIIVESTPVYFDADSGVYNYVFGDVTRNGLAGYYENVRAITLVDGTLSQKYIAYKSMVSDTPNAKSTVTYTASDGKTVISEDEYAAAVENAFAGLEKKKAAFGWTDEDAETINAMDGAALYSMLEKSYEGFSIK